MMMTMKFRMRTDRLLVSVLTAVLCWGTLETVRAAAPAQTPLLSGSGAVSPNVVFTLDDSGSMLSAIMPELYTSFAPGERRRTDSAVAIQMLTPNEALNPAATVTSNNGYNHQLLPTRADSTDNTLTTTPFTTNTGTLIDATRRSSRFNTIYYNPETLYKPWTRADGTLMDYPAANSSGQWVVRLDPVLNEGTVDLSRRPGTASGSDDDAFDGLNTANLVWCAKLTNAADTTISTLQDGNRCESPSDTSSLFSSYHIASWYEFNAAGTEARRVSLNAAIRSTANATTTAKNATTFTRGASRTDCANGVCTWAQEMRNYATWFVYYRTRLLLAKGAVAKAFSSNALPDFRFGYGALNNPSSDASTPTISVDGTNTKTLVAGVRRYTDAKPGFYTWLFNKIAYSGTPLRRAVGDVGLYFSRQGTTSANSGTGTPSSASDSTKQSPWADDADLGSSTYRTISSYAGCRRAFHILTTDGYWTNGSDYEASEAEAKVDVEAVNGTAITGTEGRSYTYTAANAANTRYRDGRSNMLADASMYYWKKDLAPLIPNAILPNSRNPAFWQHLVNYTVGLGTSGNLSPADLPAIEAGTRNWPNASATIGNPEKSDDLLHAAYNSRGLNLSAANADEFAAQLVQILQDITSQTYSTAGVATSGSTLTAGTAKYVPSYVGGVWTGDLNKFAVSAVTGATVDSNTSTPVIDPVWSANAMVPAHGSRNIFVWNGSAATAFDTSLSTTLREEMGTTPFSGTDSLINYIRGDTSNEGTGTTQFRARASKLGDIVNSNPLYVKNSVNFQYQVLGGTMGPAYLTFLSQTLSGRTATVFVGANDGMLHAFADNTGTETFAFIPRAALPNLSKLAGKPYDHQFYVDGPLTETHIYTGAGTSASWKSVLLGSMGAGGRSIFALNITSTASLGASNVMWELNSGNNSALGHVTSEIEVGPVKVGTGYRWIALVGNGTNSTGNRAQLLVVDMADGSVLKTIDTGVGSDTTANNNGLGGVRAIRNTSGVIQAAYGGDLKGNLWRFNFSGGTIASWQVAKSGSTPTPLYSATDRASPATAQPITAAPTVLLHPRGGVMVVFGTGKLIETGDRIGTGLSQRQTLYGVRDLLEPYDTAANASYATVPFSQLQSQTINTTSVASPNGTDYFALTEPSSVAWDTKRGWYMDLTLATGQRQIYPGILYNGFVFLSTIVPADTGSCSSATGFNGLFDALNGTVNGKRLFDTNGDGVINSSDISSSWYESPADGQERLIKPPAQVTKPLPGTPDPPCQGGVRVITAADAEPKCVKFGELSGSRTWRVLTTPPQ
ncbi:MAG: hypothetical protein EOP38_03715 [Rubrivivax sp.]|nr:MAG: hypothetical protein EOP38_03715 [Rubrivivax sp.]